MKLIYNYFLNFFIVLFLSSMPCNSYATFWTEYLVYVFHQVEDDAMDENNVYLYPYIEAQNVGSPKSDFASAIFKSWLKLKTKDGDNGDVKSVDLKFFDTDEEADTLRIVVPSNLKNIEIIKDELAASFCLNGFKTIKFEIGKNVYFYTTKDIKLRFLQFNKEIVYNNDTKLLEPTLEKKDLPLKIVENKIILNEKSKTSIWFYSFFVLLILNLVLLFRYFLNRKR